MDGREDRAIRKAAWRLLPLLILLYLVAYIDRQNVSFAKLQMLDSLGLTEVAYGLGASLFFIGYLIFEVPSNMALHRLGARRWIARIMLTWGLVTITLAWTRSATMFYILRFLLGAAEAGLYPGIIYYMTLWFPARYRVQVVGYFTLGSSLGNMIGALVNGCLLDMGGTFGLAGWQWVFLATGIPPVILTFVTLRFLPDSPHQARFLDPAERAAIVAAVARDTPKTARHGNPLAVLLQGRIFVLAFFYMMISIAIYGIGYWLPTVVQGFGVSSSVNGMLNMIPWFLTSLVLLWLPGRLRTPTAILRCVGLAVVLHRHLRRIACGGTGGAHDRRPLPLCHDPLLLVGAAPAACRRRGGGWHRRHQRARQYRRVHRPEHHAVGQGHDRQRHGADAGAGRMPAHARPRCDRGLAHDGFASGAGSARTRHSLTWETHGRQVSGGLAGATISTSPDTPRHRPRRPDFSGRRTACACL